MAVPDVPLHSMKLPKVPSAQQSLAPTIFENAVCENHLAQQSKSFQ